VFPFFVHQKLTQATQQNKTLDSSHNSEGSLLTVSHQKTTKTRRGKEAASKTRQGCYSFTHTHTHTQRERKDKDRNHAHTKIVVFAASNNHTYQGNKATNTRPNLSLSLSLSLYPPTSLPIYLWLCYTCHKRSPHSKHSISQPSKDLLSLSLSIVRLIPSIVYI